MGVDNNAWDIETKRGYLKSSNSLKAHESRLELYGCQIES